jgi:hypothetical protein
MLCDLVYSLIKLLSSLNSRFSFSSSNKVELPSSIKCHIKRAALMRSTTISSAGLFRNSQKAQESLANDPSGGTAGCVIAGRLAENPDISILVVEAGATNKEYPATAIPAA